MRVVERDSSEIDEQINAAYDSKDANGTKWPDMSYEDGVTAALEWVTGQVDDLPMD